MTFGRNNKNMWHDIHTGNWYQKLYDLKVAHMPWESPTYTKDSKLSSRRYKINLQRKVLHANWEQLWKRYI